MSAWRWSMRRREFISLLSASIVAPLVARAENNKLMKLNSTGFTNGAPIPRRYTCDGEDLSPPLAWSGAPAATRSFVLLCDDPDAPGGTWHHWAVYDIPADQTKLTENAGRTGTSQSFKQAVNDFQKLGYGGPCPPRGHGIHHYHFRLLALSVERLALHDKPSCGNVEQEARKHAVAEATLIGVYQR
jgi:Raf kinase inhibitor-like YbhB/YbcL family protein